MGIQIYNDVVQEGCALYAKFPVWSKVAVISRGSWAGGASYLTAGLSRLVSRPAALPLPWDAGSASFSRVSRPSSTALMRRFVRSLLCWNLSALSWRTLNSVAGCFSTSSGAPYTVSWAARCRSKRSAESGRSTGRPCGHARGRSDCLWSRYRWRWQSWS